MKTIHPMTLALEWAARGIPAFPIEVHDQDGRTQKRPLTKNGHRDASVDIDTVRDMFVQASPSRGGTLAVGLCPGAGGYVVLDPDVKDGQDGPGFADSLGIPEGWLVITASGGQHRWFAKPDPEARYSNATPADWHGLIDIRADNGWVVAPGTVTPLGSWVAEAPWPPGGPPAPPQAVQDALRTSGAPGEATEAHRAGRLTDERRGEIHEHTLAVYDWLVLNHGAHDPQIMTRVGDHPYLTVCRPGKSMGISATIGFASPGSLFVWSSGWPGLPVNESVYPLGRDQDLLGADPPALTGTLTRAHVGAYFVKGAMQVTAVVEGVMAHQPFAIDVHRNLWTYRDGVWSLSPGRDALAEAMFDILGNQYRAHQVDSVITGVNAMAPRIDPDSPNPQYINLTSGMLDWRTGETLGHAPEYHSVNQLPLAWDPMAVCPEFDRWIAEVLPPDLTTRDYGGVAFIDLVLGYLVTTGNPLQVAVLLLGSGGNGKTLFLRVVEALLGRDNYSAVSLRDLSDNRFRAHSMYGKIANICGDLDSRRLESTDMFKRVTGGDVIGAEQKYGRAFEFVPQAVPLFSANAVFGTPDTSDGYFRRWLIIPFPNSFVGREDATLLGRLTAEPERQGILARAVRGARALGALGRFPVPPSIAQAQTQFREESDPIRAYIADCLEVAPGHSVTQKDAYDIYRVWAAANGRGELASATFGSRLGEAGITRGVTMGKKMLRGVALTVRAVHGELIPLRQDQTDDQDPLAGLVG